MQRSRCFFFFLAAEGTSGGGDEGGLLAAVLGETGACCWSGWCGCLCTASRGEVEASGIGFAALAEQPRLT
jgi:hypothetical protein